MNMKKNGYEYDDAAKADATPFMTTLTAGPKYQFMLEKTA